MVRRFFRLITRLLLAAVVIGVPAALIYLQYFGFGAKWSEEVARAISGPAYRVEIGRLTFHPFSGIVAEDAGIFRRDATATRLARVDRLIVTPDLASLLRGRISIDRLDLENTSVTIPFADDGVRPDSVELRGIRAAILSESGQLTITRAECWLGGIHLVIKGQLLNPEAAKVGGGTPDPAAEEKRAAMLRAVLRTLDRFRFSGPAPELSLSIRGDLRHPEEIVANEISLRTGGVQFDDLRFDRLTLAASFGGRTLRVANLQGEGPDGGMRIAGEWNFAPGSGRFNVSGGLKWAPLLVLAGREDLAREIVFDEVPDLEAAVTATAGDAGPVFAATGRVSTGRFRLKGMTAKSFSASVAWKDGRLFVQDAVLQAATGEVRADVMTGPDLFKLRLDSAAMPGEFLQFFGPKERQIIELLEFKDTPKVHVVLDGTRASLDALTGTGSIELGRSAMRGSWVDFAKSDLVIEDRAIVYENLTIGKGKLRATGSFTYDFGRQEVRLDGVRTNIDPPDVLMWVDPRIAATVAVYRFRSPPDVRADGVAHMKDPSKNDLRIVLNAPGGMAYSLLNRDLIFGDVAATVSLKGQRVLANVNRATLYGGDVAVNADVSIKPDDSTFGVKLTMDRVDFPSLTKLYFGYAKSEGVMSGRYNFTADLKNAAAMRGSGSLRVEEGHVLAIPLFGPISVIIGTIIPGAGHESARLATMDFTIADQRVNTKNLEIQGAGFELFGDGNVGFPSGKLDLTVRINAKGIPGLVLFPVSKLFEYVSTGTMSDPQWRPKIIPREFFDVLGMGSGSPPPARPSSPARPINGGKVR